MEFKIHPINHKSYNVNKNTLNKQLSENTNHKSILVGDRFLVFKLQTPDTTH